MNYQGYEAAFMSAIEGAVAKNHKIHFDASMQLQAPACSCKHLYFILHLAVLALSWSARPGEGIASDQILFKKLEVESMVRSLLW